jgi:hypothetical protein
MCSLLEKTSSPFWREGLRGLAEMSVQVPESAIETLIFRVHGRGKGNYGN